MPLKKDDRLRSMSGREGSRGQVPLCPSMCLHARLFVSTIRLTCASHPELAALDFHAVCSSCCCWCVLFVVVLVRIPTTVPEKRRKNIYAIVVGSLRQRCTIGASSNVIQRGRYMGWGEEGWDSAISYWCCCRHTRWVRCRSSGVVHFPNGGIRIKRRHSLGFSVVSVRYGMTWRHYSTTAAGTFTDPALRLYQS